MADRREESQPRAGWGLRDAGALLVLGGLWLAMALTVHPGGEFPLNDDWAYASSVEALLSRGVIELRPWTPAVTLSHTLWGALASLWLGFSFESLRTSMLVLGAAGVLATYGLLRDLGSTAGVAALGALTIAVDPIYFALAGTFMTDVSFLAFSTLALWGFARALRRDSGRAALFGGAAALLATLNRQVGLALPIAFAAAALPALPRRPVRALLPLLACGGALVAWQTLAGGGRSSLVSNVKLDELGAFLSGTPIEVAARIAWNAIGVWLGIGLLTLPFALLVRVASSDGEAHRQTATIAVVVGIATAALAFADGLLPLVGNVLQPTGIGPTTLRDTHILRLPHLPEAPWTARLLATAAGALGAVFLLEAIVGATRRALGAGAEPERAAAALVLLTGAAACAPLLIAPYFDRYLLPLIPVALAIFALARPSPIGLRPRARPLAATAAASLLGLAAAIAVAGTHDYLAWNRARWAAIAWLEDERGVPPGQIDGGFEYGGRKLYDPAYERRHDGLKSWWWVREDAYVVAFAPFAGRRVVRRETFARWLPPFGRGEVVVLARDGAPQGEDRS